MTDIRFYFNGMNGTPVQSHVAVPFIVSAAPNRVDEEELYYSDAFFSGSAAAYDHALAQMSLGMTMSAFTLGKHSDEYIRRLFVRIGCDERSIETFRFDDQSATEDICSYAIASKRLPGSDRHLVIVIIRSHRYGGEWVSNAHVVDEACPDHAAGFKGAADGVFDAVMSYISRRGLPQDKLKLWVSGYSRGGAVSNILGAMLNTQTHIGRENIFVYTFAAPRCVYDRALVFADNIYNIVSEFDIVPRIPFYDWGLTRYGTDLFLPSISRRGSESFEPLLDSMKREFSRLMQAHGLTNEFCPYDEQELLLDLLTDYLDDILDTPEKYRDSGFQAFVMEFLKCRVGGEKMELRQFLHFLLRGNDELAADFCELFEQWNELGGLEKAQRISVLDFKFTGLLTRHVLGEHTPATELLSMGLAIFLRYAAKTTATKVTRGTQDQYYDGLVRLFVDVYHQGDSSPIMMQHWPEAYLAWLRSGNENTLYRTNPHKRRVLK